MLARVIPASGAVSAHTRLKCCWQAQIVGFSHADDGRGAIRFTLDGGFLEFATASLPLSDSASGFRSRRVSLISPSPSSASIICALNIWLANCAAHSRKARSLRAPLPEILPCILPARKPSASNMRDWRIAGPSRSSGWRRCKDGPIYEGQPTHTVASVSPPRVAKVGHGLFAATPADYDEHHARRRFPALRHPSERRRHRHDGHEVGTFAPPFLGSQFQRCHRASLKACR